MPELVPGLVEHAPVRPVHEPVVVIGIRVGEVDEVRVQAVLLARRLDRLLERTEAPAERHLRLVAEALVVEHEHGVLLERVEDPPERHLVEGRREVDARDARAETGMDRGDRHAGRRVSHAYASLGGA